MHRPRDVLELLLADVIAGKLDASVDLLVDLARDADPAGLGDALKARCYIDAVAIDAHLVIDHVADVDADAELHAALRLDCRIALCHGGLDGERALARVHHAGELGENALAGSVDDVAPEHTAHPQG